MGQSYLESSLASACPSFASHWAAIRRTYPSEAPPTAVDFLGHLRAHAHHMLSEGRVAELTRLFYAVERLLTGADPLLEELLALHLVAPLAIDCRESALDPRLVLPHLGPHSRAAWERGLARGS